MPTTSRTAGSAWARTPTRRTASATSRWRSNLAGVVLVASGGAAVMEMISRSWWMFAWRGAVAVLFGVLALVWPGLTLLWLVALFAAFALLSGGGAPLPRLKNRKNDEGWGLALLLGVVRLAAGVIALPHPRLTAPGV